MLQVISLGRFTAKMLAEVKKLLTMRWGKTARDMGWRKPEMILDDHNHIQSVVDVLKEHGTETALKFIRDRDEEIRQRWLVSKESPCTLLCINSSNFKCKLNEDAEEAERKKQEEAEAAAAATSEAGNDEEDQEVEEEEEEKGEAQKEVSPPATPPVKRRRLASSSSSGSHTMSPSGKDDGSASVRLSSPSSTTGEGTPSPAQGPVGHKGASASDAAKKAAAATAEELAKTKTKPLYSSLDLKPPTKASVSSKLLQSLLK